MGKKSTCIKYKVVMARSAAGTRRALRCADQEPAKKIGRHPCGDKRLRSRPGPIPGRSPGVMRVTGRANCRRGR